MDAKDITGYLLFARERIANREAGERAAILGQNIGDAWRNLSVHDKALYDARAVVAAAAALLSMRGGRAH